MTTASRTWTEDDRSRVRWARGIHRHSQKQAAEYVHDEYGQRVDKNQWSRWETGDVATPRASAQHALRRYVTAAESLAREADPGYGRPSRIDGATASSGFDGIVQAIGSEPMFREPSFGELQRELLKADIARHATVGSLGELDYKRLKELERLLGIVIPEAPGGQ